MAPKRKVKPAEKRIGRQTPVRRVAEPGLESMMQDHRIAGKLHQWGIFLWVWQLGVMSDWLSVEPADSHLPLHKRRLYYRKSGLTVPRQNGKSYLLGALVFLLMLILQRSGVYTSYRAESALDLYQKMRDVIDKNKVLRAYFPDSHQPSRKLSSKSKLWLQALDPKTGKGFARVDFYTRLGGSGRGGSKGFIIFDEAQEMSESEESAWAPTAGATKGVIFYVGTAATFEDAAQLGRGAGKTASKTFFANVRARVLGQGVKKVSWNEWGVTHATSSDDVDAWYEANPSLNLGTNSSVGLDEDYFASIVMSDESFLTEHLGYWPSQAKQRAIDITRWEQLATPSFPTDWDSNITFGIGIKTNITQDKAHVAIAIRTPEKTYVQVVREFDLSEPWVEKAWEYIEPYVKHGKTAEIAIDGSVGRYELQAYMQQHRAWNLKSARMKQGKIRMIGGNELAEASSFVLSSIKLKEIAHLSQPVLDAAVEDAEKRYFSRNASGYGFQSISGKVDVNSLETVALAIWASQKKRLSTNTIDESGIPEAPNGTRRTPITRTSIQSTGAPVKKHKNPIASLIGG